MASKTIPIMRYDYGSSEFNGYPPNVITEAASAQAIASADTITIDAGFKDHKTLFAFVNTAGASASVTFKASNSYQGVKDLDLQVPSGTSYIWIDSARFADKETGKITVTTTAAGSLAAYGIEMR